MRRRLQSSASKPRGYGQTRHPWLTVLLTALLTSFGAGAGGYFFGDSLKARSEADIRKEVLKTYFATDNNIPGKRKQILAFIRMTLAKNDPDLAAWRKEESDVVDQVLRTDTGTMAGLYASILEAEEHGRTEEAKYLRQQLMLLQASTTGAIESPNPAPIPH